ncbi:MAG: hypothetical protein RQ748_08970 [Elusimicrobiales bacterium]|nr:hypothetical protein [Elusimicrobiales bacterium]
MNARQDLSIAVYEVGGNKERSFYRDDHTSYFYEGLVDFNEKTSDSSEIYGNILYRLTDDRLIDPQTASLKQMTVGYRDESKEIVAGDSMAYFSDYSLNNALRGLNARLKAGKRITVTLVSGVAAPGWDLFWKDLKGGGTAKRNVWGTRAETALLSDSSLIIGVNYGAGHDDAAYFAADQTYKRTDVFSSDFRYMVNGALSVRGEVARSFTEAYANGALSYDADSDGAYRAALEFNGGKVTANAQYDRADPNFETTGGFSAQDLETLQANGNVILTGSFTLSPYLSASRDNLKRTKTTTTERLNPGLRFAWRLSDDLNLGGGLDLRGEEAGDGSADNDAAALSFNVAKNWAGTTATLNYENGRVRDKVNADQDRDRNSASLGLNGSFVLGGASASWDLQENASLEKNISAGKSDLILSHSGGIGLALPKGLEIRARVALFTNNFYENANDSAAEEYTLSLAKKFGERADAYLDYSRKDNTFDDSGNDYSESKLNFKISYRI